MQRERERKSNNRREKPLVVRIQKHTYNSECIHLIYIYNIHHINNLIIRESIFETEY